MRRPALLGLVLALGLGVLPGVGGAAPPRVMVLVPFDATALERQEQWMGEGVVQVLAAALAHHPAVVQLDRSRLRAYGQPEVWGEAAVIQAARGLHADVALFGRLERRGRELVVRPRAYEAGAPAATALDALTVPEGELLARLAQLPGRYLRALGLPVSDAEATRIDRAARLTPSLEAFELFARAQQAASRGGREANEAAAELLARAIEADPSFVVAHYTLGVVHKALGNRWKAAAQFRASTQLDAEYPEPFKALGDLYLAAPRRLFDQALEAYGKAVELRPFYADAYVGLGDARAAKGDVDGAIAAYQKALAYNPVNPRVHLSLGKIYYAEKGLYYESVGAYQRAITLDPLAVEARMGLGEVYEEKGLYQEAIAEYRKVIEIDAKHTGAMYNLAAVYEKVDPREAIALWERYIEFASALPSEKDWVDIARQHLRKLRDQLKP